MTTKYPATQVFTTKYNSGNQIITSAGSLKHGLGRRLVFIVWLMRLSHDY